MAQRSKGRCRQERHGGVKNGGGTGKQDEFMDAIKSMGKKQ